ncbi:MAG TPA: ABC transporter substrate-binding protein, partial [Stellaceae bacterium]|nr:ABC transporter substrate-binding protein [Stellaceae bacterium]
FEFNVDKAKQLLDKAGWKPGSDGIREKDGMRLKVVYQTSINAPRQKNQEIVKQACQKAGIEVEIKAVPASVFFSSDVGNPDTYTKFYADMQMYTTTMTQPDPGDFMRQFLTSEIASKENKWQGRNIVRYRNPDYDKLYEQSSGEPDPVKRAALFIQMNNIIIKDITIIPDQYRPSVAAISNKLHALPSAWDSYIWNFYDWYADA